MFRPRILFLDAYDSFSNNIVSLLTTLLDADVDVLAIDTPSLDPTSPHFRHELRLLLRGYDAVVCGPGPGSPTVDSDVGLMKHIWELDDGDLLPVLGICLGFQGLAVSCGAAIRKLSTGLHGMIREIDHVALDVSEANIFQGVPTFKATLYHSLCADIGQDTIPIKDWVRARWKSPAHLPDIMPLAWVEEPRDGFTERILMAMKHRTRPFWGLQYHPESVCSEATGHMVIKNWFARALSWSEEHGRRAVRGRETPPPGSTKPSLLKQSLRYCDQTPISRGFNALSKHAIGCQYVSRAVSMPAHVQLPDIIEVLQGHKQNYILLDSASAHANRIGLDVRGRYSIIALDVDEALRFEYSVGQRRVTIQLPSITTSTTGASETFELADSQTIWHVLADFMDHRKISSLDSDSPFLGGFMGYVTYELGLECINVAPRGKRCDRRPDLCFAWITSSIVIDHLEGTLRVQSLHPSPSEGLQWATSVVEQLQTSPTWEDGLRLNVDKVGPIKDFTPPVTPTETSPAASIKPPDPETYEAKVRRCQDLIATGESYELCLTDQTTIDRITVPSEPAMVSGFSKIPFDTIKASSSWQLYRALRACQPAPFGSYIRMGGATLVSSSPERFLEYNAEGLCSMRPMKGTVKKSAAVATLAEAERILHIPKEEAENLMIVDLVRHDLHGICGPGNVNVPQLLKVEEYASVFQMISVVEGQLPKGGEGSKQWYTGLDVLAASLPPGSMTGAPKKRSCELLQEIEDHQERSLYSGVVGYMDVAGRGDWSVTIRSLFRWDDETVRRQDGTEEELWHIGAGGAVTALSTPEGERDEMFTKLRGPLAVFQS